MGYGGGYDSQSSTTVDGSTSNAYPRGMAWDHGSSDATFTSHPDQDYYFETYVRPPAVQGPTDKEQCKKGGWARFTNPTFKNQGECVDYANHH